MKNLYRQFIATLFLFASLGTFCTQAATLMVEENGAGGAYTTINAAIADANNGDIIMIHPKAGGAAWVENIESTLVQNLQFVTGQNGVKYRIIGNVGLSRNWEMYDADITGTVTSFDLSFFTQTSTPKLIDCRITGRIVGAPTDNNFILERDSIFNTAATDGMMVLYRAELRANYIESVYSGYYELIQFFTSDVAIDDSIKIVGNQFKVQGGGRTLAFWQTSQYVYAANNYIDLTGNPNAMLYFRNLKQGGPGKNACINNTLVSDGGGSGYFFQLGSDFYMELRNNLNINSSYTLWNEGDVTFDPFRYNYTTNSSGFVNFSPDGTNSTTSNTTLNAYGRPVAGSDVIDGGDPDPMYNDRDGTRNDAGAFGGENPINSYWPCGAFGPLPTPSILGSTTADEFQSATYSVAAQDGYSYNWTVTGGNIISGLGTNAVSVQWGSAGDQTVSLTLTDPNGCTANVDLGVTVGCTSSPSAPVIAGSASVSVNSSEIYTVSIQSGYTYNWSVMGGTIQSGQNSNSITVQWGDAGAGTVSLVWTDANGCESEQTDYSVSITTPAPPTANWVTVATDAVGDGFDPNRMDGIKLEYMNKWFVDSLFFRVTVASISAAQAQNVGVNIMVNVQDGGNTFDFWGNDNTDAWHRLLSTWVTGTPPSDYSGPVIGIADAAGVGANNFTTLSQNNVSIDVNVSGATITLGINRADLVSQSELYGTIRIAAAVGASDGWNDDIYDPNATMVLGIGEPVRTSLKQLEVYPNPTTEVLFVTIEKPMMLEVTDMLGQTVLAMDRRYSGAVDVSSLTPGVYLIHDEQHTSYARFIKQ